MQQNYKLNLLMENNNVKGKFLVFIIYRATMNGRYHYQKYHQIENNCFSNI